MATNEEMLVSEFQEKVAIRSSVNLANMFSYVSQWPDYLLGSNNFKMADYYVMVNQIHGNFRSKTLRCRKMKSVFRDVMHMDVFESDSRIQYDGQN